MLTLQIPTLLALLATALMAIVIFAPERAVARPTISFAPPLVPAPVDAAPHTLPPLERYWEPEPDSFNMVVPAVSPPPAWPVLVDPRAAGCDASARMALVEALISVGTPWAHGILQCVLDDENDPGVRSVVVAAGIGVLDAAG